ncbi:MAG: hypothetical protein IPK68_20075 [Bdellovibrionales bacterium]|nr:hypothetical protein [Bdellovibrionales bacterium]
MTNIRRAKEQLEQQLSAYDKFVKETEKQMDSRRRFLQTLGIGMVGMSAIGGSFSCAPSSHSEATIPPTPDLDLSLDSRKFCVDLPKNRYQSSHNSDKIVIETNGIPNHLVGIFPNLNCPCAIRSIEKKYAVDLNPQIVAQPKGLNGWLFGVAVNGLFSIRLVHFGAMLKIMFGSLM